MKGLILLLMALLTHAGCPRLCSQSEHKLASSACQTACIKLKSGSDSVFYPPFPGIMVHGCSYISAGEHGAGLSEPMDHAHDYPPPMNCKLNSNDHNESIFIAGAAMFLGSWLYDIIGTPSVVKKINQQLFSNRIGVSLDLKKISNFNALFIKFSYDF